MKFRVVSGAMMIVVSALLIAGINFSVTRAVEHIGSGTIVGGIISGSTTWTLDNSPYTITDTVQIPGGNTLTIEPGVIVTKPSGGVMFLLAGAIVAHGTIDNRIVFDGGGNSDFFSMQLADSLTVLDLEYCIIKNGNSFWFSTRTNQWASLTLRYCELIDISSYSNMYYFLSTGHTIYIEYNKFINSAGFLIGCDPEVYAYIRYNLYKGNRGSVLKIKPTCSDRMIIEYNSFVDIDGVALELCISIDQNASNNYWGTTDTDVIDSMIYDGKDYIGITAFIRYLPILTESHPDTPCLLENLEGDIDGIFRKDDDDKWRCYVNTTIRNRCHKNVTILWIYLHAINITYVDETFEELNILGNETINGVIQPEQELSKSWKLTAFGFSKEPKFLWVLFKAPILEAYGAITQTTVIPEFPSFLILPLFMIATLLAVTVYRRKHSR